MAPLPQSVLVQTDARGHKAWFEEFRKNLGFDLHVTCTSSPSMCKEIHPAALAEAKPDTKARDAEIAQKMHVRLQDCAPVRECAWTSCNGIVQRSFKWFSDNKDTECMKWSQSYDRLKKELPTADEVYQYQQAALKWRRDIGYEINQYTKANQDSVVKIYRVGADIITDIRDLLEDMKLRRNKALNIAPDAKKEPAAHVEAFRDWLKGGDWTVPCPWGEWDKKNTKQQSLGVTACAGLINKKYYTREGLKSTLAGLAKDIREAAAGEHFKKDSCETLAKYFDSLWAMTEGFFSGTTQGGGGGGFVQQGSAIDTPFSSHYWAWRAGVRPELFPSLSAMLFSLGKSPQGKTKVEKKLKECPFAWAQTLVEMFAEIKSDAIHMHPGVLTAGRMASDMVCSFGAFPVSDPYRIREGSSSPRFLLNLRSDKDNPAGRTISALFREFKAQYADWKDLDIVPVEHMLHQTFLSKLGPFVNVYQVEGLALAVDIKGIEQ